MSEELEQSNDGTWSGLKKTIIGVATTAVMGLGTWGVTKLTGGGDESAPAPAAQPSIIINNSQQQAAPAATKTVVIKEQAAAPAQQAAPAPKPKPFSEDPKW